MLKIYGIKNCDSVKKAIAFFKAHNIAYELIDFKTEPATHLMIEDWISHVGIEKLFNAKSTTYRTLNLGTQKLDESQKAAWLAKENLLIKRPVVAHEGQITVGFDQKVYEKFLPQDSALK